MKTIFLILTLLITKVYATNYYVSATGNDAAAGTSTGAAWLSINKVNSSTFANGDSILFKRGDTFFGVIIVNRNGVIYDAYGTGAKPIITGLQTLTGWTGTTIQVVTNSAIQSNVNILLIDGKDQNIASTPDSGSYYYFTAKTTTKLKSASVNGLNFVGAEVVMFPHAYKVEKATITAHGNDTLTYTAAAGITPSGGTATALEASSSQGAFRIQKHTSCMTAYGEFMLVGSQMRVYAGSENLNSHTVQTSFLDTLFNAANFQNITVKNLQFTGANQIAIYSASGTNLTVKHCSFNHNGFDVMVNNTTGTIIDSNDFKNSYINSVVVQNRQRYNVTVTNNTIDSVGLRVGQLANGYLKQGKGIVVEADSNRTGNANTIKFNTLTNIAHGGIEFLASNLDVDSNYIQYFNKVLQDNGGIYTFTKNSGALGAGDKRFVSRRIRNNIILNSDGLTNLTLGGSADVAGLYLDDQSENILATGNVISGINGIGIQLNNPLNQFIYNNIVYDCDYMISTAQKAYSMISGLRITNNIFYPKFGTSQFNFFFTDANASRSGGITNAMSDFGVVDSNYLYFDRANGFHYYYSATGGANTFPPDIDIDDWDDIYGHETQYTPPPVAVTGTILVVNATNSPTTYTHTGINYIEPDGTTHSNSTSIPARSAKVLINNGGASPPEPQPSQRFRFYRIING